MASKQEIHHVLTQALEKEKLAEEKCGEILQYASLNGFTEVVEHIKNDEIEHQKIVDELITMLAYKEED